MVRLAFSLFAGVVTFLGTMTLGCDDAGGVPSWERCTSWLGNPILEWPGGDWNLVFPIVLAIVVGSGAWWVLGRFEQE